MPGAGRSSEPPHPTSPSTGRLTTSSQGGPAPREHVLARGTRRARFELHTGWSGDGRSFGVERRREHGGTRTRGQDAARW